MKEGLSISLKADLPRPISGRHAAGSLAYRAVISKFAIAMLPRALQGILEARSTASGLERIFADDSAAYVDQ
jgi:hypothetical protein